jgi:hypothetical protein
MQGRINDRVLAELVAQSSDGDAKHPGCMGAVAEAIVERVENEATLDFGDRPANKGAGRGLRRSGPGT